MSLFKFKRPTGARAAQGDADSEDEAKRLIEEGNALEDGGRLSEALSRYDAAIQKMPELARAFLNRGNALLALGKSSEAMAAYTAALARDPAYAAAHFNMGTALQRSGQPENALPSLRNAIAIRPEFADAHVAMGNVLADLGRTDEAIDSYRTAMQINPHYVEVLGSLDSTLRSVGRYTEAVSIFRKAIELNPTSPEAHLGLGNALESLGLLDEAMAHVRQAISLRPDYPEAHTQLLYCLSQDVSTDPQALFREHTSFAERYEAPLRQGWTRFPNLRDPDRALRVGIVSADLRYHSVARFFEPVLAHLTNAEALSLNAYFNHASEDEMSRHLRRRFASWRNVAALSDAELAQRIRDDGIDILIDLSGHTAGNRLLTFARKPAPIQASWIGYPGTTGLQAMDYYLADRHFLPLAEFAGQFTEKLVHLPAIAPFLPDAEAPPVNTLPALSNGYISFGSFNRLSKLSPLVIALWSQLLRALPDARMLLGAMPQDGSSGELLEWFAREGIGRERLDLHARCSTDAYLALHHRVDLCLDAFPYTGGTTTAHALWMGVPTLTLAGHTPAGRQGAAFLGQVGLDAFVATSVADYLARGVRICGDLAALADLRARMRARCAASAMWHPELIAAGLESALRIMWQRWCNETPPTPIVLP